MIVRRIEVGASAAPKRYTRSDYTALRAWLRKIPIDKIADLYYSEEVRYEIGCPTVADIDKRIVELHEHLITKLSTRNPMLSQMLVEAKAKDNWSAKLVEYLIAAGQDEDYGAQLGDSVSAWFRPLFAKALKSSGIQTMKDLKDQMQTGSGWYKSVPRVGPLKAIAIEQWFRKFPGLGELTIPKEVRDTQRFVLTPYSSLMPLEVVDSIEPTLSGRVGRNRNGQFCLISARSDLEAVEAYLYKFRQQSATMIAYKKELERFVLWGVLVRKTAMSDMLIDDCEAYKDFLNDIPRDWIGPPAPRTSERWRPFSKQLQVQSQKYAVQVLRSFFDWLVKVRYLGGNPWVAVATPKPAEKELPLAIEKAIPQEVWARLTEPGGYLDAACKDPETAEGSLADFSSEKVRAIQFRLARAAISLMGSTGVRREEAASASRDALKPVPGRPFYELAVLGKRKKWRTVFVSQQAIENLRVHWQDRNADFDVKSSDKLLSPIFVGNLPRSQEKHGAELGGGFSPRGLYALIISALKRLPLAVPMPSEDAEVLRAVTPHALRHTFATHAVAKKMPTDVVQTLLGHESIDTTSIYIRAERARVLDAVEKFQKK